MPIFKNHRGQFHKMNTALVALASLYVVGAVVAVSSPYLVNSYPALAPLGAFASTTLGMGILTAVAVALVCLAVYAMVKNNEVSELKAPKIIINNEGQLLLMLSRDVLREIKENGQHKDEKGKEIEGQYCIYFTNAEHKECRVIISNSAVAPLSMGNSLFLPVNSFELKNKEGKYEDMHHQAESVLGLSKDGGEEFNTYLHSVALEQSIEQKQRV